MPLIHVDMNRPYDDDDPTPYVGLPATWPHDASACPACSDYRYWEAHTERAEGVTVEMWDDTQTLAQNYPKRFMAIMAHRSQVAQARRASKVPSVTQ